MIKVKYSTIDGYRKSKPFKTLKGARKFAQYYLGKNPDIGFGYAVSFDGVGKIQCEGVPLRDLFGELPVEPEEGSEAPGFDSPSRNDEYFMSGGAAEMDAEDAENLAVEQADKLARRKAAAAEMDDDIPF